MDVRHEFVFEEAPFPSCHASTIVECADGALLCAWFGGEREGAPDVGIWASRRTPSGWSAPQQVGHGDDVPCWNPVLHRTARGTTLLFYKVGPSPQTWTGVVLRSEDDGRTWSPPEQLPAGILGPVKNKPLELADGTLVCGSSVESYRAWACWVERTADEGRTWTKHGPIAMRGYGMIQPAIVRASGGVLAMLCRTSRLGRVVRSTSDDAGLTWAPPAPVDLPHNNSGLDAVTVGDGRVLLVYNHVEKGRTPLNVAFSDDLGLTWEAGPVLEQEPGEYSYPAVISARDGAAHITYTWQRRRIRHVTVEL